MIVGIGGFKMQDKIIFPGKENKDYLFKEAAYHYLIARKLEIKYQEDLAIAKIHKKRAVELLDIIVDNNYMDEFLAFFKANKERMGINIG